MAAGKLTLEQLVEQDPKFCAWVIELVSSNAKGRMKVLNKGKPFREFLTVSEEKRMDAFLFKEGEPPEWVHKCHKIHTSTVETVMCFHCCGPQLIGTKCLNSDNFHF